MTTEAAPARTVPGRGAGDGLRRLLEVCRVELAFHARRPLFWVLLLILAFFTLELSRGQAQIGSGSAAVGGGKAHITSEFAVAQLDVMLVSLVYMFFLAIAAGMSIIRDTELRIGEVIHATPLRAREYVWGKFLAVFGASIGVFVLHQGLVLLLNHGVPHGENVDVIGPFVAMNYVRPAVFFVLPLLVLFTGVSFAFGALTRQPILVFFVPVAVLLGGAFFFWEWSPSWMSQNLNRILMVVDLTGLRWLKETWLDVDRGVAFYNTARIGFDGIFFLNRALCLLIGLGAVELSARRFGRTLGGGPARARRARHAHENGPPAPAAVLALEPALAGRTATTAQGGAPGVLAGAWEVARIEIRGLLSQPGLYLFVPLILIQTFGSAVSGVGAFDAPLLHTPGTLAVGMLNTLTLLVCLLQLFYTVESLQREKAAGFAPIAYATPLRTASLLFGKALANTLVGIAVVLAVLAGCAIDLAVQRVVPFDFGPFALTWGLLLAPTFFAWTAFVCAAYAVTGSRYGAYGIGLTALIASGWFQLRGKMNWAGNWDLWGAVHWSDMSVFELDRSALVLNRLMVLGLAVFFTALTVRVFARRERDATRLVHALQPARLGRTALGLAPFAIAPLMLGTVLWTQVQHGLEVGAGRKLAKDYWKQNVATWADAPVPGLGAVNLDVDLEPRRNAFRVSGHYDLVNRTEKPLSRIPITAGPTWDSLSWTMQGEKAEPENRSRLFVFTPARPMAPGDTLRIGFRYRARLPRAPSKNGGGTMFFVLPSSVVLTGFDGPGFVPIVGFVREIGVEDENRADPKIYPPDYHVGITPAYIGIGEQWFHTRIRVTGPAELRYNATGVLVSEEVRDGRRTMLWQTDHPVRIFNLVGGRWAVKRGKDVTIYYHPKHAYNLNEMMQALEGARRHFSDWFAPYPWRDLRLSEFPDLSRYAQGPPTNITFSEGIGFLTRNVRKSNSAFFVTAHEAAHQWWGNILMPAAGPGNVMLSEGMAHYSTILLTDRVKGLEQRIAFCKSIEDRYANRRHSDDERPLLDVRSDTPTDRTVTYDKGGWVMWMLTQFMGREAVLAGLREFIAEYRENPDHPTMTDLLATLRKHAPDDAAFDAFTKQWFREVVLPEYKLSDMKKSPAGKDWIVTAVVRNVGTGRMPIEVAAARGERFPEKPDPGRDYREARTAVTLGPGESARVELRCPFEPVRMVVDPDVKVLQLERARAEVDV